MAFAKLFDTEIGQVLVKIDSAEEHQAEVRIYFEPEGFGVCSTAFSFDEWADAEAAFGMVDAEKALEIITPIIDHFGNKEKSHD